VLRELQSPRRPDHHGGTVTWIAEMPIVWIFTDGERVPGQIAIGAPELERDGDGDGDGVAICPITMGGLDGPGRVIPVKGEGKFHALLQGIHVIEKRIRDSVAQGIRVELPDFGDDDPERDTEFLLSMFKPFE
jgi:hypothetical protein